MLPESQSYRVLLADLEMSPLTREQERALSDRIKAGDPDAAGELVEANMKFAVWTAKQFSGSKLPMEDIVQGAFLGMMRAAQKFDADRGFRFISYAALYARQGCQVEIARMSAPVVVPIAVTNGLASVMKFYSLPGNEATRLHLADVPAIAESTGQQLSVVAAAVTLKVPHKSLDSPINESGGAPTWKDSVTDASPDPSHALDQEQRRAMVESMLASIDQREAFVLRSIFLDFDGASTNPYPIVGEMIGVSRERVRQIKNEGLASLRRKFGRAVAFEIA